jgi:hypothetical protein
MGESKHHIALVVGLTLLPSHLSPSCFIETMFRKRPDDQTSRNCQTRSQKSRVRDKLVQTMLLILFPCFYPSTAMSSVSIKRKPTAMAAELVFSDEATIHLSGKVNCHHISFLKSTPIIQPQRDF